jgi:ubiquinone/menaquinone biosynthesis C-methylase UbiE
MVNGVTTVYYQLGSHEQEQARLEMQAKIYDDAKYIQFSDEMNICELGCGNGINLWIAENLVNGHYIGVDLQIDQIKAAKGKALSKNLKNVEFLVSNAAKTSVASHWADLTFCRLVLVHNPNPIEVIREMVRITKSNGKILAIEPNNLSHIAYNKPYLNKCYHARVRYMYAHEKGTLDICPQLYHLFKCAGVSNVTIKQHSIYFDSREPKILKELYENWAVMLTTLKDQLLKDNIISTHDYDMAMHEAENINDGDSIYQCLWIAEGAILK